MAGTPQIGVRLFVDGDQRLKAALNDVGATGERAMGRIEASAGRMGGGLQNASFQIADVFAQISGGTDPMRAIGIQLPQLLAGFGLFGAVAGAVASILPVVFSSMMNGVSDIERLESALKDAETALSDYQRAASAAIEPMDRLIAKYGEQAEAVQRLRVQEAELARARAVSAVSTAMGAVSGRQGVEGFSAAEIRGLEGLEAKAAETYERIARMQALLTSENARFFDFTEDFAAIDEMRGKIEQIREGVDEMAVAMGLSFTEAQAVAAAFAEVEASARGSAAEQIAAGEALIAALTEAYGSIEAADEATDGLVSRLIDAVQAGADLAAIDMAGPIGDAARNAGALATSLASAAAYSALIGRTGQSSGPDSIRSLQWGGGLRGPDGGFFVPQVTGAGLPFVNEITGARGGRGGGGGGADRERAEAMREAERIFRATRTEAEKYAEELARLDELLAGGFLSQDTYNRALDDLKEKYGEAGDAAKFFKGINDDLKDAILDLALEGEASFDRIAKSIARAALEAALFGEGPLGEFFGGGLLKGLMEKLDIPSFDGGGTTGTGARMGGVDGKGGFMALLHPNDTVIDHTKMRRAMFGPGPSGGGGGATVQINNYTGQPVQEERTQGPDGETLIRVTVGRQLRRGDHDGALGRYGAKPTTVKR